MNKYLSACMYSAWKWNLSNFKKFFSQ